MTPRSPAAPVVVGVDQGKSGTRALAWQNGHTVAQHFTQLAELSIHVVALSGALRRVAF